jgi:hypothetical protein
VEFRFNNSVSVLFLQFVVTCNIGPWESAIGLGHIAIACANAGFDSCRCGFPTYVLKNSLQKPTGNP